jgi:hypothetical protein
MKKQFLIFFFVFINLNSSGQYFKWAKNLGGPYDDFLYTSTIDKSNNILSTGYYNRYADFDPDNSATYTLNSQGAEDIYISKLDNNGKFIWAKSIGSSASEIGYDIITDKAGNVYVTGTFTGTVDFDPGSNTNNLTASSGKVGVFILKLDASGNFVWAKSIEGKLEIFHISIDDFSNVFISGTFFETVDFDPGSNTNSMTTKVNTLKDIYLLKLDGSGNFIWSKTIDTRNVSSINTDTSENIYLTGVFSGTVDFDPGSTTYNLTSSKNQSDVYILKLNSKGIFVWAKSMGSKSGANGYSLKVDASENIYIAGSFYDTSDFNPGAGVYKLVSKGQNDIFILKLNKSGVFVWAKAMGSSLADAAYSLTTDKFGDIYITGQFNSTIDFDPGSGTNNITAAGSLDAFVLKLNAAGNFVWAKNLGGTSWEYGLSINLDTSNNIYISGEFGKTCDFDPGTGKYEITSSGGSDIFLVKLSPCLYPPSSTGTINGSSTICENAKVSFSVTSVSEAVGYNWEVPKGAVINAGQNTTSITVTFAKKEGYVKVTPYNFCGKARPDSLFININNPVISISPTVSAICSGSSISLTASAANSYIWYPSKGLNDSTQGTVIATPDDTTSYRVIGKNSIGCVDTVMVTVDVNPIPKIINHPDDLLVNVGSVVQFSISSHDEKAFFQWQQDSGKGFTDIINSSAYSGINNDTLTIHNVKLFKNNWKYRCISSNGNCSDTSNSAELIVNCILNFTKQPIDKTLNAGSDVLFVSSSSSDSANYQWLVDNGSGFVKLTNNGQYAGVTNDTLTINDVKYSQNNYKFKCIAEDGGCFDSTKTALLKVNCVPIISTQPTNQSAYVGANILFTTVSSISTATYQWQQNIGSGFANLSNSGQYSGITNDTLTINNLTISQNNYSLRCIVLDDGCFDTSSSALLTVKTSSINSFINQKNFSIYPNPANDFITIKSSQTPNNLPFIITDQIGKQILKGELNNKSTTIDISSLTQGFYFLQIGEVNKEVFKIMKK